MANRISGTFNVSTVEKGNNAPSLSLSLQSLLYSADSSGAASSQQDFAIGVKLMLNTGSSVVEIPISTASDITYTTLPTGLTQVSKTTTTLTVRVAKNGTPSGSFTITAKGTYGGQSYSASAPVTVAPVSAGEASAMMDLANEYQMVLTSSEGTVPAETSVVTVVLVYEGVSAASTAAPTAASITPKTGSAIVASVTPSGSAHTHIVTYTIPKGTVLNAKYDLDISVTYKGNTYTKQLTVAASMGEPEYHLDPNYPVIPFRRKSDNTLEPASWTLTMRVLKIDMDDSEEMTIANSGMIVRYTTNGTPPSSKTSGTAWGTSNGATGISWSSGNMVISNSTDVGCICVAMYNTGGVLLDRESIPVIKDGANGQDGADGNDAKMYWYEGEWSNVTTSSVTITDNQTCYFLYGGEYWMWVGGAGTYTYHDMGTPSDSNTNFEKVQSKWKYILSEAIFTDFAHLGGFIVSGSWLYSTYGTVNGVNYTSTRKQNGYYGYLWFDTSMPFVNHQISRYGTTGYNFIPNFAVDGASGKTYQMDATVKGKIEATEGSIGGFSIGTDALNNTNYDASVVIQNAASSPTKVAKLGKDAKDAITNESCSLEAQSKGTGTYNTALYLDASGATYNYAFHGNGNGVLNGLMFGFKTKVYTVSGTGDSTAQMILTDGATFVFQGSKTSGKAYFKVPTLSNVKLSLGLPTGSTVPFAIELNFINHSSYDYVYLQFYNSSRTTLPKWYDYNFETTAEEMQLAKGDFARFLLTFDGSNYRANRIIHHDDGR